MELLETCRTTCACALTLTYKYKSRFGKSKVGGTLVGNVGNVKKQSYGHVGNVMGNVGGTPWHLYALVLYISMTEHFCQDLSCATTRLTRLTLKFDKFDKFDKVDT